MEKRINKFTVFIEDDYAAMSARAANIFADEINAKPNGVFGFATGGTPVGMYAALIELYKNGAVDFSRITSFNLDEYYPIRKDNDQSYYYFMRANLFDHVNIKPENINIPDGEAEDHDEECIRYSVKIWEAGGIDMQLLGIGGNGHIGFNEPDDIFPKYTRYVDLNDSTINANARFFADASEVPKNALTMGILEILFARKILLVASGAGKAEIIRDAVLGDITPGVPASALQFHRDATLVLDKDAAALLY